MSIPMDLDRRFRDAAARSGMLDAGYDLVETPLGELLVAAADRGLLRISFDPDPDAGFGHSGKIQDFQSTLNRNGFLIRTVGGRKRVKNI